MRCTKLPCTKHEPRLTYKLIKNELKTDYTPDMCV